MTEVRIVLLFLKKIFVKGLENITLKKAQGTLPRYGECCVSWIGCCHMDIYLHKSSLNYILNLCISYSVT